MLTVYGSWNSFSINKECHFLLLQAYISVLLNQFVNELVESAA